MKSADKPLAAELIQLTLQGSKLQTMQGIYNRLRGGSDARIRTKLAPYTETGRLRSGEDDWWPEPTTNLQNLPKKAAALDPLYEIRNIVIPSPGHVFIEGDLSQAEVWATAAYAGDDAKLERLAHGDEHLRLAAAVFNISEDAVTKDQRNNVGKPGNHKLNYGVGWKTFMEGINKDGDVTGFYMSPKLAKATIAAWEGLNPKTVRWREAVKQEVYRHGSLTNCFGRKRIFLNPNTAGNDLIAYLPQSTIADLLNTALVRMHALEDASFQVMLQIHDAILLEVKLADWAAVARLLHSTMLIPMEINGRQLTVPVDISMSGKSWGKMKKVKI